MHHTLTVDPGIRVAGVALFHGHDLIATNCVRGARSGSSAFECAVMAREIRAWFKTVLPPAPESDRIELLTEWPQVYTRDKSKGDPNDLIALAGVCAAVAAVMPGAICTSYRPREWKHTIDGDVMTGRILGKLTDQEIVICTANLLKSDPGVRMGRVKAIFENSTAHNAVDAIGIGLHHFGRLERQRVFAR